MGDSKEVDDGIHPLDRDYAKPVPSVPKRLIFTKSRGINVGIVGFGLGGVLLLIGIVVSQFGEADRSVEAMAGNFHRLGMWSILFGGGCIIFTMQTRADKPRRKRKKTAVSLTIAASPGNPTLELRDWRCALADFDQLVVAQLTSDCLRPELGDVYLDFDGRVLAVLRWDGDIEGVIRVRFRRRDLIDVKQRCCFLLAYLGAELVDDSSDVRY
ncbi:hypothetical protein OAG34_00120 [bacterium]|nr:hypothetical protein [bacterium]